jgi:hypothetical protein
MLRISFRRRGYNFQGGGHPRLFFDAMELSTIRERLDREPYASTYAELLGRRDSFDFYRPYNPLNAGSLFGRAKGSAMIYALSGDEGDAAAARSDIEAGLATIGEDWASSSVKGLTLYAYATDLAIAYDLCAASMSWDSAFKYQMSKHPRAEAEGTTRSHACQARQSESGRAGFLANHIQ